MTQQNTITDEDIQSWFPELNSDNELLPELKSSLREKADNAKILRCKTLYCVLENPRNIGNIGAVIRNIDALGIGKLYVVDGFNLLPKSWNKQIREGKLFKKVSSSACKWAFVRRFDTTAECFEHLKSKNFISMCTSPHIKGKENTLLYKGNYTQHHLAIWFGNETDGITDEVVANCRQCIQIEMAGIVESMNLACCTAVTLWYIAQKRREYWEQKHNSQ
jgi:tRNA (guanosine-2'-O-)-methyltransferase